MPGVDEDLGNTRVRLREVSAAAAAVAVVDRDSEGNAHVPAILLRALDAALCGPPVSRSTLAQTMKGAG